METTFNIEQYLTNSIENIVKGALKASLRNPRESLFLGKYALAAKRATQRRHEAELSGTHLPAFLIASITSSCNLHCSGCYSRGIDSCSDAAPVEQLSGADWGNIFHEASDMGISFIILAGGEPFMRKDVIEEAAKEQDILFPIFTNGTMINSTYLNLFDHSRNLFPVLSIEGGQQTTDARRGAGTFQRLMTSMEQLKEKDILFGASVTVTTENMEEVLSTDFIGDLYQRGAKVVFLIEFVPTAPEQEHLAPEDSHREYMDSRLITLRKMFEDMMLIAFPGDEKKSAGCLAAGRGFFHINSHGGAEPCPFSPYSDGNVKEIGLRAAVNSPLFRAIRSDMLLEEDHSGGCALFHRADDVQAMLSSHS